MTRKNGREWTAKWSDSFPFLAFKLTLAGFTNKQLADVFDCNEQTIDYWMRTKAVFRNAVNAGKDQADGNVTHAFYKNCIGYDVTETRFMQSKNGFVPVQVTRHIPGNAWAQKQWLAVRQRAMWGDVTRIETKNTNINILKLDKSGLSTAELLLFEKLQLKQLTEHIGDN